MDESIFGLVMLLGWLLPLVLAIVISFLTPGRRGYLSARRESWLEAPVDEVINVYAERLFAENFKVDLSQAPLRMIAKKKGSLGFGSMEIVTSHAKKSMQF